MCIWHLHTSFTAHSQYGLGSLKNGSAPKGAMISRGNAVDIIKFAWSLENHRFENALPNVGKLFRCKSHVRYRCVSGCKAFITVALAVARRPVPLRDQLYGFRYACGASFHINHKSYLVHLSPMMHPHETTTGPVIMKLNNKTNLLIVASLIILSSIAFNGMSNDL